VLVGDLATLLAAIGTFGSFATSSIALAIGWRRTSRKERRNAAEGAAERAMDELLDAVADGQITAEELEQVRRTLRRDSGHHGDHREEDPA
jgi:uncharacterized membrane protein